jgi:hypothetical protein
VAELHLLVGGPWTLALMKVKKMKVKKMALQGQEDQADIFLTNIFLTNIFLTLRCLLVLRARKREQAPRTPNASRRATARLTRRGLLAFPRI